jgi:tetratricopeptide (TPR) repeat protein
MGWVTNKLRIRGQRDDPGSRGEASALRLDVFQHYEAGRYVEAAGVARQLIERQRETVGETHPEFATDLTNLALLLQKQGDLANAEPLLRQALAIRKQALGENHPDHATSLSNLALLLCDQWKLDQAEPLLRQSLAIRQQTLGEAHPDYATSLSSLALLLQRRGDLSAAEPLLRQALAIRNQSLGEQHPDYASALCNLASLLQKKGDREGPEPLLRQALAIRKETLGERHPDYEACFNNLALLRKERGERENGRAGRQPPSATSVAVSPRLARRFAESTLPAGLIDFEEILPVATPTETVPRPAAPPESRPCLALGDALRTLTNAFKTTSERLLQASQVMSDDGRPPDRGVLEAAAGCDREFARLRAEAVRRAEANRLVGHSVDQIRGLRDLAALIESVNQAEDERVRLERVREQARRVVDRVLTMTTAHADDSLPLLMCQTGAREIRQKLLACVPSEPSIEAERLAEGRHPLSALIAIVEGTGVLDDATWGELYRRVATAYGMPLAVAAGRDRLSLRPEPPCAKDGGRSPFK